MSAINYNATKTASQFHLDDSFVRLLFGPVRCGKTVASCMEIFKRACEQEKASDGIRYSRWAIFRNTYPELKMTTIKTWLDWFPENVFGKIKWDSPISQVIRIGDIRLEIFFVSIDRAEDISKLLSLELTGAYFNEVQFIPEIIFDAALKRVCNYPAKKMGVPITWGGVIADTNPPDSDHWIFERFEKNSPKNHKIFKYESALIKLADGEESEFETAVSLDGTSYTPNPEADYFHHLQKDDYYLNSVQSSRDDDINIYLMGQYGALRKNKRVYPEYNEALHCVKGLRYAPTVELGMGFDFGRNPTMILAQLMPWGGLDVLEELTSDDMGTDEFIKDYAVPLLNRKYKGWKDSHRAIGDPAGKIRNSKDDTDFSIIRSYGINASPAKTNNFTPRREAVSYFLRQMPGGRLGFRLDAECSQLRKGFLGDYHYPKYRIISDDIRYRDNPDKNNASHPQDALQYIAMEYRGDFDSSPGKRKYSLGGNLIF